MDELYYSAVDLLKRLVATESVSRQEAGAADVMAGFFNSRGYRVMRSGNNVWVTAPGFDPSLPSLLLNSHIDTVRPVDGWVQSPFEPVYDAETDRLYGLGSNDAGASVVSLAAAFLHLASLEERGYNLTFLASCEEEVSGRGGLESVVGMLGPVDFAIVGEPTGMRPAIAEKGLMVIDAEVYGRAGHAARDEGDNAIYHAVDAIATLRAMTFARTSAMLGPVKISVTQIEAGTQHNVVPDLCRMVIDVRTTDAYSNAETLEMMRQALPGVKLTPRSTRLNPSGVEATHPFVARAVMMGLEPFGSPTLSDQALMPWPSVKIGPGDSARSHTAQEYICLAEIREAIATYITLLTGLRL